MPDLILPASLVLPFILTLVLTVCIVLLLRPLASRFSLLAAPGEHRRHDGNIPLIGGLCMTVAGIICVQILVIPVSAGLGAGILLLLVIGSVDDRWALPYWIRFVFQIIAAMLLMHVDGVRLIDLGHVFSSQLAPLGPWSGFITVFAMVGVINAINMVDGMDGLAASLALVSLASAATLLWIAARPELVLIVIGIAVLAGFLLFNLRLPGRPRALVFMGDAGSTVLGFFVGWVLVGFSQGEVQVFPPVLALYFLAIPLYDAVGVLLRRPLRGGSPFDADWLHTHHLLLRMGLGVNQCLLLIVALAITIAVTGILLLRYGMAEHVLFYLFMAGFALYIVLMETGEYLLRQREQGTEYSTDG